VARPYDIGGHAVRLTACAGVALYPAHGADADTLLKSADLAMYRAKDMGRNRLYVDEASATVETVGSVRNQLKWLERLKHCLETGDFQMFFQAIVPASPHQRRGRPTAACAAGPTDDLAPGGRRAKTPERRSKQLASCGANVDATTTAQSSPRGTCRA
jgi:predicted signal transduction protein with EAL and GGDEF domain